MWNKLSYCLASGSLRVFSRESNLGWLLGNWESFSREQYEELKMGVLPPGTLLQLMYLDERLKVIPAGRFIEIGPGSGEITSRLLKAGWTGTVYDLSDETISKLKQRFSSEVADGRISAVVGDFLQSPTPDQANSRVDLVISGMVMEHMDEAGESNFMRHAAKHLSKDGCLIGFVPASPIHWGIEDEIAGHFRRYDRKSLELLFNKTGWVPRHMVGLTYPTSNMLLPLSNFLVRRNEAQKLNLSALERTKHSGNRNVRFKTHFPSFLKLILNEITLLPLHWIQKVFSSSESSLVIYFEATEKS
jgi:SAM-dependent methyltransferase